MQHSSATLLIGDSAGRKLKDAQLLGYPWVVVLGRAWRKEGLLELQVPALM